MFRVFWVGTALSVQERGLGAQSCVQGSRFPCMPAANRVQGLRFRGFLVAEERTQQIIGATLRSRDLVPLSQPFFRWGHQFFCKTGLSEKGALIARILGLRFRG